MKRLRRKEKVLRNLLIISTLTIIYFSTNIYKASDNITSFITYHKLNPIEKAKRAIAVISVSYDGKNLNSIGSGVVISPGGLVITNRHVIEGKVKKIRVNVRGIFYTPKVVFVHKFADIALLKIYPEKPLPYVKIAIAEDMHFGSTVYCIGNPLGIIRFISKGVISRYMTELSGISYVLTDALILPGSSGGGMFNPKGELIGINTAIRVFKDKSPTGIGIAISSKSFIKIIEAYRKY